MGQPVELGPVDSDCFFRYAPERFEETMSVGTDVG
jgi:hypothetical protein